MGNNINATNENTPSIDRSIFFIHEQNNGKKWENWFEKGEANLDKLVEVIKKQIEVKSYVKKDRRVELTNTELSKTKIHMARALKKAIVAQKKLLSSIESKKNKANQSSILKKLTIKVELFHKKHFKDISIKKLKASIEKAEHMYKFLNETIKADFKNSEDSLQYISSILDNIEKEGGKMRLLADQIQFKPERSGSASTTPSFKAANAMLEELIDCKNKGYGDQKELIREIEHKLIHSPWIKALLENNKRREIIKDKIAVLLKGEPGKELHNMPPEKLIATLLKTENKNILARYLPALTWGRKPSELFKLLAKVHAENVASIQAQENSSKTKNEQIAETNKQIIALIHSLVIDGHLRVEELNCKELKDLISALDTEDNRDAYLTHIFSTLITCDARQRSQFFPAYLKIFSFDQLFAVMDREVKNLSTEDIYADPEENLKFKYKKQALAELLDQWIAVEQTPTQIAAHNEKRTDLLKLQSILQNRERSSATFMLPDSDSSVITIPKTIKVKKPAEISRIQSVKIANNGSQDLIKEFDSLTRKTGKEYEDSIQLLAMDLRNRASNLLAEIKPYEFRDLTWSKKPELSPNLIKAIEECNQLSHQLQYIALREGLSSEQRAKILTAMIHLEEKCKEDKNYFSLMILHSALSGTPLHRIISDNKSKIDNPLISDEDHEKHKACTELCAPKKNFIKLRQAYQSDLEQGERPLLFLGMFGRDLTFISEIPVLTANATDLNVNRILNISRTLNEVKQMQSRLTPSYDIRFNWSKPYEALLKERGNSSIEQHLNKLSLSAKPREIKKETTTI